MKINRKYFASIVATICLFILIIDTKTAITGASEGVKQCIYVLIPSLFPFFLVSGLFCSSIQQLYLPFLSPICKLCKIPKYAQSLFITGILGGYPVGAKEISSCYKQGLLSKTEARRLLGFCNNAGPSFVFGIIALQFSNKSVAVLIFVIQILSAIFTGAILPGEINEKAIPESRKFSFMDIFHNSLRSMAYVCGWVILFRAFISFLDKWLYIFLSPHIATIITGLLELANGCLQLGNIPNEGVRFIVASALLSFGGICVYFQTASVTETLGTGLYFPGKMIQTLFSIILSGIAQLFLFTPGNNVNATHLILLLGLLVVLLFARFLRVYKKRVAIIE